MKRRTLLLSPLLLPLARAISIPARADETITSHGIARYDDPLKYQADFTHFAYVNPDAPKGGLVKTAAKGKLAKDASLDDVTGLLDSLKKAKIDKGDEDVEVGDLEEESMDAEPEPGGIHEFLSEGMWTAPHQSPDNEHGHDLAYK